MSKKALIMYVPNLHAGYDQLINDVKPVIIRLLDHSVIAKLIQNDKSGTRDYLGRSFLYARRAEEIKVLIKHIWKDLPVRVLDDTEESLVKELRAMEIRQYNFVMPEEDVSRYFYQDYLRYLDGDCSFSNKMFLRYNKLNATDKAVPNARRISEDESLKMLNIMSALRAREIAQKSDDWWRQVGAIVFDEENGELLLAGYNKHLPNGHHRYMFGDARSSFIPGFKPELVTAIHAEQMIFAKAAKAGLCLSGLSMYVSTYPCPYCANQIALSGIKKLYFTDGYSVMDQGRKLFETFDIETVWLPKEVMTKAAT